MAQEVNFGVNNKSRKVKEIYIGIDGKAREVKEGFIGVNGIAKQFYKKESVEFLDWDIYDLPYDKDGNFNKFNDIEFGNGMYIALSSSYNTSNYYTTYDFKTWNIKNFPIAPVYWGDIAYGNNIFVATSGTNNNEPSYIFNSSDGINWNSIQLTNKTQWVHGIYVNNMFLVYTNNNSGTNYIRRSTNGTNWTQYTFPASKRTLNGISNGTGIFIFCQDGDSNNNYRYTYYYSTNGTSWTTKYIPQKTSSTYNFGILQGCCYGKGTIVLTHFNSYYNVIRYSTDNGTTWNEKTYYTSGFMDFSSVHFLNNQFIEFYNYNKTMYSLNGIDWVEGPNTPISAYEIKKTIDGRIIIWNNNQLAISK